MTEEPWTLLEPLSKRKLARHILDALTNGPQRYTDVLSHVTQREAEVIHPQTFSKTLRWLRDQGYIDHHAEPTPEYWLTEDGRDLAQILDDIERVCQRRLGGRPDTTPQ
jgi:DNA-binding HxlR family transcriptional regulator